MTYQPLPHKKHFSKTFEVFELLLKCTKNTFSEEELLNAADTLLHIGNGKISYEKIKEFSYKSNHYSHCTDKTMEQHPWRFVPQNYAYDEETSPYLEKNTQEKINYLMDA